MVMHYQITVHYGNQGILMGTTKLVRLQDLIKCHQVLHAHSFACCTVYLQVYFYDFLSHVCERVLVGQLCPMLCSSMHCSPSGSSVCRILQVRIMEWVAIPFSKGYSWPRDWPQVSNITDRFFTIWDTREALAHVYIF